jgi:hypothetical protein
MRDELRLQALRHPSQPDTRNLSRMNLSIDRVRTRPKVLEFDDELAPARIPLISPVQSGIARSLTALFTASADSRTCDIR